jgi:hypothetical protein
MKFTKNNLRQIGEQLIEILAKFSSDGAKPLADDETHKDIMEELGFTRSDEGSHGAWLNKGQGYVFKTPYLCMRATCSAIPRKAIPTAIIKDERFGTVYVQPLADTSSEAVDMAKKVVSRKAERTWGCDAYPSNIGMYNGKVVVFDW